MKNSPHIETVRNEKLKEDVAYVKAKTQEIENRIVAATENLFESAKERELLHISIRVSCDFHKFLLDFGDTPPQDETEYIADTVRSGIDWFYLLAFHCHGLRDDLSIWRFNRQTTTNFPKLREACLREFDVLCQPSSTPGELLASLLALIHLELIFMVQVFPSTVDSSLKAEQWQA
jgi:hypothetical protein